MEISTLTSTPSNAEPSKVSDHPPVAINMENHLGLPLQNVLKKRSCASSSSLENVVVAVQKQKQTPAALQPEPLGSSRKHGKQSVRTRRSASAVGRFEERQKLIRRRTACNDYAFAFAMIGLLLMITDNEFRFAVANPEMAAPAVNILKALIVASTVCLICLIGCYHFVDLQLFMVNNGIEDWKVALSTKNFIGVAAEVLICASCPVPFTSPFLDFLLSIPMFLRFYLFGRILLLHSSMYTDTSSRSIAALTKIHFNVRFIIKSLMTFYPGTELSTALTVFATLFCTSGAYVLTLCERYEKYYNNEPATLPRLSEFGEALWMVCVTFLTIGYGDIVPDTYCGKSVALVTGMTGVGISSLVIAVVASNLQLSVAEKRAHDFVLTNALTKEHREMAANIIRETWLIYKCRNRDKRKSVTKITWHQRKLLRAIIGFRRVQRELRIREETYSSLSHLGTIVQQNVDAVDLLTTQMNNAHTIVDRRLLENQGYIVEIAEDVQTLSKKVDTILAYIDEQKSNAHK